MPAQQPTTGDTSSKFTSETTEVLVPALVRDAAGKVVYTLQAGDFVLTDDGVPQMLTLQQEMGSEPLALVIVIEVGGAGSRQFQNFERLVPPLAPMLPSIVGNVRHRVAVVTFDSSPKLIQNFTSDLDQAQATLRDIFPKDKLGASQAIFSLGAIVGPSVGPTLGGWLTDNFSWNYVFFINIVPGVFAAFVILTRLKNPTEPRSIPVDGIGLALLACGLGSLQYILDEGQRHDWFDDPLITLCGVAAVVLLGAFALWELFGTDDPVVDLYALRYRAVLAGTVLGLAIGASLFGAIVILPQFLEGSLGYTATLSGYMIFCRALAIAVATPFMARVAAQGKIDTRILLVIGFAMTGISQLWLGAITTTDSDFLTLVAPAIFGGVGLSFVFVPLSIAVLGSLPPHVIPKATAFQSLSFQLGGSLSTAALVTLLARRNAFHQEALAQFASLSHQPFAQMLQEHVPLAQFYGQIIAQATVMSFADAQYALGILTFGLMPLIFVLPRRRRGGPPVPVAMD